MQTRINFFATREYRRAWILLFSIFVCIASFSQTGSSSTAIDTLPEPFIAFYGQASYYANKFHGRLTASGEVFSQHKLTAACNVLPLGTRIRVTNLVNGNVVVVKTNDRLHPKMRRLIDLSRSAAEKLGYIKSGLTRVRIEVLNE